MMDASSVACMAYVYQNGQLVGVLCMEHSMVIIQERDTASPTWSWELNGEYIGKAIPPDMEPLRLSIITPKGECKGKGIWMLMPGEKPCLVRGTARIQGSGRLQGPRPALRYLGFHEPKRKGGKKGKIDMRKAQEELATMIAGGYHKELIKTQAEFVTEYVNRGFSRDEAIRLVIAFFCGPEEGDPQ